MVYNFNLKNIESSSDMKKLLTVLEMVKFEHTIFALPFAFLGALLAARGLPDSTTSLWIVFAIVGARSSAMAFNRLVDRSYDGLNPRTRNRALPSGLVNKHFVIYFVLCSSALFFFSSWMLNTLSFHLSPVALMGIFLYSYTKRWTSLSHIFLGLAISFAPLGGWIAVRGELHLEPLYLAAAVLFWVGGFDIIYACLDIEFDRETGLYSIPSKWGVKVALQISALFHILMVLLLSYSFFLFQLSTLSWLGLVLASIGLIYEHSLVKAKDLRRVNTAFFTINGIISLILLLFVSLDLGAFS